MAEQNKQTIYIDVDDEITAVIDKVKTSNGKIVALVLPKRATVLQSIVNMKLLKKAGIDSKKNLVLITSEAGLMPMAGSVGLHVAKSLQSKPEIPLAPIHDDNVDTDISEAMEADEPKLDKSKSIGDLAATKDADEDETIELDDLPESDDDAKDTPKKKSIKGFKIPNFDRFRLSFFMIILIVLVLIGGWIYAAVVLPKALVTIKTDTSTIPTTFAFNANTATKDLDVEQGLVPATQKEVKKNDTEKATATGKKDNGTKATGTMTLTNCINDGASHTVPAGTSFSSGSLTFLSNEDVTLEPALFSGQNCKSATFGLSKNVGVTASNGGANYNLDARSYASSISGITASGSAMTGGTTSIITVVSQADVDAAVTKMKGRQDDAAKKELNDQLQSEGLMGLQATLTISDPAITVTPAVGEPATGDITIASITTYNILGVKSDYLNQLIKKSVSAKTDALKQGILDNGLAAATITVTNKKSPTDIALNLQTIVVAGPKIDVDAIKEKIRGKKKGDAEKLISSQAGVTDVTIKYSPFWVYSTPKSAKKITINIDKPVVKPATGSQTPDVRIP